MQIDSTTKQAIQHTYHCLIGCGIGEVLGMVIATALGWEPYQKVRLAVGLAFVFGYALTYFGVRKHSSSTSEAIRTTLATDTVSIATMEVVANTMEFILPGALMVGLTSPVFWYSLAISMTIAFVVTVPVNRYMISRNPHIHSGHTHH